MNGGNTFCDLPLEDAIVRLKFPNSSLPADTRFRRVVREYVDLELIGLEKPRFMGSIDWTRFVERLLPWLRGESLAELAVDSTWYNLVNFAPLGYSWYASIFRPPFKLRIQNARVAIEEVAEVVLRPQDQVAWLNTLSTPPPVRND